MTCKERYSDLEKSIYLPSPKNGGFSKKTFMYEDGYDVTKTEEFVSLHPCAQLGAKQVGNHPIVAFTLTSFSFRSTTKPSPEPSTVSQIP